MPNIQSWMKMGNNFLANNLEKIIVKLHINKELKMFPLGHKVEHELQKKKKKSKKLPFPMMVLVILKNISALAALSLDYKPILLLLWF